MTRHPAARVVVVGAGVIGSAIAWQLASRGARVALIDTQPYPTGATAHSAGILRRHHTLTSDTRLAAESLVTYRDFAAVVGGDCGYRPVGFLMIVDGSRRDDLTANAAVARTYGEAVHQLCADTLRAQFPGLVVADSDVAVLEPDGGNGDPFAAARAWQAAFTRAGGEQQFGVRVQSIGRGRTFGYSLATNIGAVEADAVVVANGVQASRLLRSCGVALPITPRRIGLAHLRVHGGRPLEPDAATDGPVCIDDVTGTYYVPRGGGTVAVGVRARPECESDVVDPLTGAEIDEARARAAKRLASVSDSRVVGAQVSCDGYTPDRRPVLGPVGPEPGLIVAAGFSGGGFKIAPAVADHIATAVLTGRVPEQIAPYAPGRFAGQGLLAGERPYVYM